MLYKNFNITVYNKELQWIIDKYDKNQDNPSKIKENEHKSKYRGIKIN